MNQEYGKYIMVLHNRGLSKVKVNVKVLYSSCLRFIVNKYKTSVCGKTSAYDKTSLHDQIHVGVNKRYIWGKMIESEYYEYNQFILTGITVMQM